MRNWTMNGGPSGRVRTGLTVGLAALSLAMCLGGPVRADDLQAARLQLAALETRTAALGAAVDGLRTGLDALPLQAPVAGDAALAPKAGMVEMAQSSRDLGALNVRVSQLEEEVRTLTGQVQGLQFQMTQMQTLIENIQADTDARISALEGKPGKKTEAAPHSGGAMPAGGGSQTQTPTHSSAQTQSPKAPPVDLTAPDAGTQGGISDKDTVIDPKAEGFTLGAPPHPLGTLQLDQLNQGFEPDISADDGQIVTDADAEAQYKAGYDAVIRGDYAFAEDQFRQFIGLFPDNPHAPDATNWLGEALIQRGEYSDAANILLNGFETYPNSTRAPDILLKLGIALAGTGEQETACRTFDEVFKRFPNQPASFNRRVVAEKAKAGCS